MKVVIPYTPFKASTPIGPRALTPERAFVPSLSLTSSCQDLQLRGAKTASASVATVILPWPSPVI
jgi:hypothetical protein